MKKFFNKIVLFLTTLFTNLDEWIHDHVQPSIEMVERIKSVVDSPVGNLIAALIPGGLGEVAREEIILLLTKTLNTLNVTAAIEHDPSWENKVMMTVNYIKSVSKPMQDAIYLKLASEMAKIKSGSDSFKGHSVDLLVQMQYSKLKEGVHADDLPNETIVDGNVQTPVVDTTVAPITAEVTQQSAVSPVGYAETLQAIAPQG